MGHRRKVSRVFCLTCPDTERLIRVKLEDIEIIPVFLSREEAEDYRDREGMKAEVLEIRKLMLIAKAKRAGIKTSLDKDEGNNLRQDSL